MEYKTILKSAKEGARNIYKNVRTLYRYESLFIGCKKADFLIIGAQKCGTSSLYHAITEHSQIERCTTKEIHYFSNNFEKGINWYKKFFPNKNKLSGEASTSYLFDPRVAERVYTYNPNIKLIVLLRDPVERAYSQYWHNIRKKRESRDFDDIIRWELKTLAENGMELLEDEKMCMYLRLHSYLIRGWYNEHLAKWFEFFPKNQFLILKSDDFFKKQDLVLDKCFSFLGVKHESIDFTKRNTGMKSSAMSEDVKNMLTVHYNPYNEKLVALLGENYRF